MSVIILDFCTNPDILRVLFFAKEILKIVFFIMPIGLLVMLGLDFFKNVSASREDDMKKNLSIALKRIVYCIVIFLVPTVVSLLNSIISDALGDSSLNYITCIDNANLGNINKIVESNAINAYNKALEEKSLSSIIEAEDAVNKMNDTERKKELLNSLNSLKNVAVDDIKDVLDDEDDIIKPSVSNNVKKGSNGEGLWVAHQKNSADLVNDAISEGFWGIEVDVQQVGNDFKLFHDTSDNVGYSLSSFLDTCKDKKIIAVLDLKTVSDYEKLVEIVKKKKMQDSTIYQVGTYNAEIINKIDDKARIWILISDSKYSIDASSLVGVKDYVEGVNMRADHVDAMDIKAVHDMGLTICSFSYNSVLYSNADAKKLRDWGSNYIMANNIDES